MKDYRVVTIQGGRAQHQISTPQKKAAWREFYHLCADEANDHVVLIEKAFHDEDAVFSRKPWALADHLIGRFFAECLSSNENRI